MWQYKECRDIVKIVRMQTVYSFPGDFCILMFPSSREKHVALYVDLIKTLLNNCRLDFKLSLCPECCMLSFW